MRTDRPFSRIAVLASLIATSACTPSEDARVKSDVPPRGSLARDALGCFALQVGPDVSDDWKLELQGLGVVKVDSTPISKEKPHLRRLTVTKMPTVTSASFWLADSLTNSISWYFVAPLNSVFIELQPTNAQYAGVAWSSGDTSKAATRIGTVEAIHTSCDESKTST